MKMPALAPRRWSEASEFRDFRRCLTHVCAAFPAVSVGFLIWRSSVNFWNDAGIGPKRECGPDPASAQACLKDVLPRFLGPDQR